MGKNVKGSSTVAAVQQQQAHAQGAKNAPAAKQQAAKPQSKPATPAKNNMPISFAAAAKPTTPQLQRLHAGPQKVHAGSKSSMPQQQQQKAQAAPIKPQSVNRGASAKKFDMGPGYESNFMPNLFQEPATWTKNQSPCHSPHVVAKPAAKQLNKQNSFKATTPVSKPSTPAPKAQANKFIKAAPTTATKTKSAIKWSSPAGKQLIVRPKNELVLYVPMWIQIHHWVQFGTTSPLREQKIRGRSADKYSKAERIQQHKQRIQNERNPNDRQRQQKSPQQKAAGPKAQPNPAKQLSRQASSIGSKSPAPMSRQASSIGQKSPNILSRQNSQIQKSAPLPQPAKKGAKKANSSTVDYNKNVWDNYYSPKESPAPSPRPSARPKPQLASYAETANLATMTASQQYASMKHSKAKAAPYMNLKAGMPREMIHRDAEGSNILIVKVGNDAEQRGLQMGPKQAKNKSINRAHSSKGRKVQDNSINSWFTPSSIAVASAIVAIGSVGISKLINT